MLCATCQATDETIILNFRHLLERHGLTEAILAAVNKHLADKGVTLLSPAEIFITSGRDVRSARRERLHQAGSGQH